MDKLKETKKGAMLAMLGPWQTVSTFASHSFDFVDWNGNV